MIKTDSLAAEAAAVMAETGKTPRQLAQMVENWERSAPLLANEMNRATAEYVKFTAALKFCRDLAEEELVHTRVGSGVEIALRHISRRATEALKP